MLHVIVINFKYPPHVSFLNLSSTCFDISLNTLVSWINLGMTMDYQKSYFGLKGLSLTVLNTPPS